MIKTFHKNRLPHIRPIGATFFITCRLADALPRHIIKQLQKELEQKIDTIKEKYPDDYEYKIHNAKKRYFGKYDQQLDDKPYGNCYLKYPNIANIVADKLKAMDGKYYDLQAYCIMPNHIHMLLDTSVQLDRDEIIDESNLDDLYVQLNTIMKLFKGSTARYANQALNRKGAFWFKDSYDHYVRDDREWSNIVAYILDNPVKAGLVKNWEEWNYSYFKTTYRRL